MGEQPARIVSLAEVAGVDCPCGTARRAFADLPWYPATVHLTSISREARTHYHHRLTEVYVIVECQENAAIELDGVIHPLRRFDTILIPPGVRHRAIGEMTVVILCTPKFDSSDEHFDEP